MVGAIQDRGPAAASAGGTAELARLAELPADLLDLLPAAVYVCAADGVIVRYNARAIELWGRTPRVGDTDERFCGSHRLYRLDGSPLPHAATPMAEVLRTGAPARDREVVIQRPDGTRVVALVNIAPLRRADGALVGAINCFQDVTERKEIEAELRRSHEELEDFFENAVVALHWVAADGTILRANRAELDLLGYTRDEYVGRHIREFHADAGAIEDILARLSRGQRLENCEARLRAKDGSIRHVLLSSNVRFRNGRFSHSRCFTVDVTERKRAEEQRELLLAELSHRVRNILAVVQAVAVRTGDGVGTVADFIAALRGRLEALAAAHSLLTAGRWQGASLRGLAEAVLAPYLGRSGDRVRLEVEDLALGPRVAQTFALVFHELVTNAAKHGALSVPGGRIAVAARPKSDELQVTWRETGGPPVSVPEKAGFGTVMIAEAITYQHEGRAELDWRAEGLVCCLSVPLSEALAPPSGEEGGR